MTIRPRLTKLRIAGLAALVVLMPATGAVAQSTTLASSNSDGTDYGASYLGQSFTAGAAGANYGNIAFSFLTPTNTNLAAGNLYLFSSAYTGTPNGLATATGVLATTTGSSGAYTFASSLTLTGGNQYFAYSNASQDPGATVAGGGSYAGGTGFEATGGATGNFAAGGFDNGFRVTGTAVSAAPEPGTWLMMIAGFGIVGGALRRRNRAGGAGFARAFA